MEERLHNPYMLRLYKSNGQRLTFANFKDIKIGHVNVCCRAALNHRGYNVSLRFNTTGLVFPRSQADQDRFLEALPGLTLKGRPITAKKASEVNEGVLITLFVEAFIVKSTPFSTPAKFWAGVENQNSASSTIEWCV